MRTIHFTTAHHQEVETKLNIYKELKPLYENIDIKKYTDSFNELTIIFQAFNPESKSRTAREYKKMRRKTRTLELYLVLDYDHIMQGTDKENLTHIKEVFHKGCETFLKPIKGFDWNEFEKAVAPQA